MVYKYTDDGRDFFEDVAVGDITDEINTVAIGDGDSAPSSTDTSLDSPIYEETDAATNTTIERTSTTGTIRVSVEVTGGVEVPGGTDVTEIGLKTNGDSLVYREVRSAGIDVGQGESKVIELVISVEDADVENKQTITEVGRDFIASLAIGESSDFIDVIAVGDGTNDVSSTDTTMQSELFRDSTNGIVELSSTSTVGEINAEITLSAGPEANDQVAGNADISEFGIFTDGGTLVLHETRPPITLGGGDTKTFKIPFTIIE